MAAEREGAGADEARLLGDVEADGVPLRDGGAQPTVKRDGPGVGDGGAAQVCAPAPPAPQHAANLQQPEEPSECHTHWLPKAGH